MQAFIRIQGNKTTEIRTGLKKEASCPFDDVIFHLKICDQLGPASLSSFLQLSIALYCLGCLISMQFNSANMIKEKILHICYPVPDFSYLHYPQPSSALFLVPCPAQQIQSSQSGWDTDFHDFWGLTRNISRTGMTLSQALC